VLYEIFSSQFKQKAIIEIKDAFPINPKKPEYEGEFLIDGEVICSCKSFRKKDAKNITSGFGLKILFPEVYQEFLTLREHAEEIKSIMPMLLNNVNSTSKNSDIVQNHTEQEESKESTGSADKELKVKFQLNSEESAKENTPSKPKKFKLTLKSNPFGINVKPKTSEVSEPIKNVATNETTDLNSVQSASVNAKLKLSEVKNKNDSNGKMITNDLMSKLASKSDPKYDDHKNVGSQESTKENSLSSSSSEYKHHIKVESKNSGQEEK